MVGRLKDLIIRGGENVYAYEVEQVLVAHPGIRDVAVVGVPDPLWGEQIAAFIIAEGEPTPSTDELLAFCRERLARTSRREPALRASVPLTPLGKVQ